MKCNKCGNELKDNDIFCVKCGNKIQENDNNSKNKTVYIITIILIVFLMLCGGIVFYLKPGQPNSKFMSVSQVYEKISSPKYWGIDNDKYNGINVSFVEIREYEDEMIIKSPVIFLDTDAPISTYYLSVKKNDFIRTRDKELVGEENDKYDEGENIEEFNRIINIWNDESKVYTLVEENIITNEYKEHLEELEALRKVYGYYFEYSQGTGKLLSCKQTDLDYDKQVEDIKRAKEAVLNKYKNARDFELNGIACVYISEEEKTYVIKLKKSDSYKCIACYKNGTNFEVKELWDFYYAYVTPVSDKLYSENFEEFSNKVGVSSPVHRPLLELARSSKNYNDYLKDMDSIFFWEDTKIYSNSLATGCTLIRGVENQFLKDNTIYNARSEEEIKENEKNVSKKDMDKIKVRITCSEFDGSFFFENDILQPFVNELKKLSSPTINFGFEGTTNIKDRFKMELKDIGTGKIYYSSTKSEYGDIYGVPLKKGNNTFEITISDNYGNVRVIKNSINL